MDLRFTPEEEAFRKDVRAYLDDLLAPGGEFAAIRGRGGPGDEHSCHDERLAWEQRLGRDRWTCIGWPAEHGGRALPLPLQVIWYEEYARAGGPGRLGHIGEGLIGPTIVHFGSPEQQQRFLPGIAAGTELWCQGYSEPDAGSDLANIATRADLDGDEWVLNGQKVWTSLAEWSDWCFVLARTDRDAPKHKGISFLLIRMDTPGIEIRPIVQVTGTAEFAEVFFSDARTPADLVVGGVNNGWKVANDTLGFERGMSATTGFRRFAEEHRLMVEKATENGRINDPHIRQGLAKYWSKIQIMRINGLRSLTATVSGKRDMGVAVLGATNKMFWSETHKAAMELALDIWGAESMLSTSGPESGSWPAALRGEGRPTYPVSLMMSAFFFSRSETIWGGTSQIQRNIVGEKVLGLPREPKVEAKKA